MKVNMIESLVKKGTDSLRHITIEMTEVQRVQLYYFVSKNTLKLFTALNKSQNV